jgi:hypothetical protein
LMLVQGATSYGLAVDCAVLVVATSALVGLGSRLYPRVAT